MGRASEMRVSDNGTNFVKKWEGLYLRAYKDIVGVPTIGYGHTKNVSMGDRLAGEWEAHQLLKEDLDVHMIKARSQITSDLTQNQYDAITSFCFNLGANILTGTNLLQAINNSDWNEAGRIMLLYCNAGGKFVKGLYNRRVDEVALLKNGVQPPSPTPTPPDGDYDSSWFMDYNAKFTLDRKINLRTSPFADRDDNIIAILDSGDVITLNAFGNEESGFVWLRQVRSNGKYGYLASGNTENGKRVTVWGEFEDLD
ncbi:lysozyme [Bacillus phage MG-B1]|uniref:Endolysin n=1 Tax=Bacillus phage MG-B1 TaxID=1309583 RepID=M4W600_9CAUD|nr:endolysin [Bacillus phage MG-B1]AGI10624.1 lysozyme [Bacillus phage MG-B1]